MLEIRRDRTIIENNCILLVAQMKRAIELLEDKDLGNSFYSKDLAELDNKLLEIRRDSVRFMKMVRNPYQFKREYEDCKK